MKKLSHLCHTFARSYFECLINAGCLSAEKKLINGKYTAGSGTVTQQYYDSVIETNGSKSEMVKVT